METWLKVVGSSRDPIRESYTLPHVGFRKRGRPEVRAGDQLFLYAAGGSQHIFALARVTSDPEEDPDYDPKQEGSCPWRVPVTYLINLPVVDGVHVDGISSQRVLALSLRQASHIRLQPLESDSARRKLERAQEGGLAPGSSSSARQRSWWEGDPSERFWCEITDRSDIGADLKSPQRNEAGHEYWSYSLMRAVWPGDVVFHYSTRLKAIVGASVAGGPLEERQIRWTPHGTVGRAKAETRGDRPGWWLPLYSYRPLETPLSLTSLQGGPDRVWIEAWTDEKRKSGTAAPMSPFQLYPGQLRASQGYLTKMPRAFVDRWPELGRAARSLESSSADLAALDEVIPPRVSLHANEATFRPKDPSEYQAMIRASVQTRSRKHEAVVNQLAELLRSKGATVSNQHPFDLLVTVPLEVLFEVKVVRNHRPVFAIREAIGQLLEYRFFLRRDCLNLCIVLDESPGLALAEFAESVGLLVCWLESDRLTAGPVTRDRLSELRCMA